ncbi:hypothetical protein C2G38_1402683 [Gigaspora rosea]|uniref:Serine-threonine/tyrosine-protein kinase catalytic domain-containing protein n=1 Tax=Gigaspora rosea TaxID=44941 RepID=A0A397VEM2_9GLOM|nr:hypothetical protein C2G38_1402683 [Gigaspora rosea]
MWEILYGRCVPFVQNSNLQFQLQVCDGLRPHIYENTAICCADLMKKCWNMEPEKRPTASEIYDIFTECQNNEIILLELAESYKQLRNIKIEDKQVYNESCYKSSFISFNSDYEYKDSKFNELEVPAL